MTVNNGINRDTIQRGANHYQNLASQTAIYPMDHKVVYPLLGLIGEVGEFANKYKKVLRDGRAFSQDDMKAELGDVLWYIAALASDCEIDLGDIMVANIDKLHSRKARGVLGGSGDNR